MMKYIYQFERKLFEFFEKKKYLLCFFIISLLALELRISLIFFESGDWKYYISPWLEKIITNGGFKALGLETGDYNIPYLVILAIISYLPGSSLVLVKAVSIIFDYVCAISVALITSHLMKKHKKWVSFIAYSIVLLLPSVLINSACWGQCDSIYTAFALLSLLFLMKKKYVKSFIFLGIAFSFKLQTIFILPLYVFVYLTDRKVSLLHFCIIPLVNFVTCLPAIIAGRSIGSCMSIYLKQVSEYDNKLTCGFPNIFGVFLGDGVDHGIGIVDQALPNFSIIFTIGIFAFIACLVFIKKTEFNAEAMVEFGLWSVMIATFFLPRIHDRYLFMGNLLSIAYLFINRKRFYIPIILEYITIYGSVAFLLVHMGLAFRFVCILNMIALILYSKDMFAKYFQPESIALETNEQTKES